MQNQQTEKPAQAEAPCHVCHSPSTHLVSHSDNGKRIDQHLCQMCAARYQSSPDVFVQRL